MPTWFHAEEMTVSIFSKQLYQAEKQPRVSWLTKLITKEKTIALDEYDKIKISITANDLSAL
jgi:hypothetical protein